MTITHFGDSLVCARLWRAAVLLIVLLALPTVARAQDATDEAGDAGEEFDAAAVVEYWQGYGTYSATHHAEERFSGQEWMEPGEASAQANVRYAMQVDANGALVGTVTVNWSGSVWLTAGAQAMCNAARAENFGYWGVNCSLAPPPASGTYTLDVTGTRTRDPQTGEVVFALAYSRPPMLYEVLSGYNPDEGFSWSLRRQSRIHEPLGQITQPLRGMPELGWSQVVVVHHGDGEFIYAPPPTGSSYVRIEDRWQYTVRLVETGGKPMLALEKELLENSVFMNAVPVDNALTANLEWNTAGGGSTAWRIVNQEEQTPVSLQTTIPRTANVGNLGVGEHEARVQAKDTLDRKSQIETVMLQVAPYFNVCPSYTTSKQGQIVSYKCSVSIPDPAFKAEVPNVPTWIPFFGGAPLGVDESQLKGELEIRSSGEGTLKGGGGTTFKAMDKSLGGEISVKGDFDFLPTGVNFKTGGFEIMLTGRVGKELPLTQAIPQIQPALVVARAFAPAIMQEIEDMLKVGIEVGPNIGATFDFEHDDQTGWRFKDASPNVGGGFNATVKVEPVEGELSMSAGVGGDLMFALKFPADPHYLKQADLKLTAKFEVRIFKMVRAGEEVFVCTYVSATGKVTCSDDPATSAWLSGADAWQPVARPYLASPASAYAQWVGSDPAHAGRLVQNVAMLAKPVLWGDGYMLWSHEEYGQNIHNAEELAFAALEGSGHTMLLPAADNRADWNPQVVERGAGALVVWQRMDTPNPGDFNANPSSYLAHMQIAAANFTETVAGPQMTPIQISDSGSLNHRPAVVEWSNNREIALWVNNPGNMLSGDAANPDRIMFRIGQYNNGTRQHAWTTPAAEAVGNIPGLIDYAVASARDDDTGYWTLALVYIRDMDDNTGTLADREVWYALYSSQSEAWSAPVRLTNNNVAESEVALALRAPFTGGVLPEVIWREGANLRHISGAWNAAPVTLPVVLTSEDHGLTLLTEPLHLSEPQIALLWRAGNEVGILRRMSPGEAWTYPKYVTPAPDIDGRVTSIAGIFDSDTGGRTGLRLVMQIEENRLITRTVDGIDYPNVPEVAAWHIYSYTVAETDPDLVVSSQMTVTAAAAEVDAPATVEVRVRNEGTEAAENVIVELVQDNLTGSDVVLATQTIPMLLGYQGMTVLLTGSPPVTGDFALVVRARLADEFDDEVSIANNQAIVPLNVALEAGASSYAPNSAISTIWMDQTGTPRHSPSVPLIVTRDAPDGAVVAEVAGRPAITANASVQISAYLSPTVLGPGNHTLWWKVDTSRIQDTESSDNWINTHVVVAPDLWINPNFTGAGGSTVRFIVENRGNWPSVATVAEIWSAPPERAGRTKVATLTIPALGAGEWTTVSGTLSTATATPYLVLDPANLVQEGNESDNHLMLSVIEGLGGGQNSIWLPLIDR